MEIDGKEVLFVRPDGTFAENAGFCGYDRETGEAVFYEILDCVNPIIDSGGGEKKKLYKRLLIQRVYTVVHVDDLENSN